VDGSRDGTRDSITYIVVVTSNKWKLFFLKEIHHGTEVHSAANILQHITDCEQDLLQRGVRANGVMSNNKEKIKKVRSDFYNNHLNDPNNVVASPRDPPHVLQLVIGDFLNNKKLLLQEYKETAEKADYITDKIRYTR
jgi:hypothetical protein